jgi:hypothetical protein
MPLEQITTEMDVQMPQSKASKLKAMMKKKVAQYETGKQRAETEAQGRELDRTVASPYKMAMAQKLQDLKDKKRAEFYSNKARMAMTMPPIKK